MVALLLKDETLVGKWLRFFEEKHHGDIETIALSYPENRSIYIDYWEIDKYDQELADGLVNDPWKYIYNAEMALTEVDTTVGYIQPHFRVKNIPDVYKKKISDLRCINMGRLVSVEGLVKRKTKVRPKLQVAAFVCQKCGVPIKLEQDEDILKEPGECYEEQGGCGRVSSFKLSTSLSTFIDAEKIQLQENLEALDGGEQPQHISVYLEDDICAACKPGDRVIITGILHSMIQRRGTMRLTNFDIVLDALDVEVKETAFSSVEITSADEKEIIEASKRETLFDDFKQSVCPSVFGLDHVKQALLLQLFGGIRKKTGDDTKIRGDIHVLLMGDPGTAKSQLKDYMYRLSPRSVKASGGQSTRAGLTAGAVKDEFSEGHYVLEAGALVLADEGIACIDEFDKMSAEDRGSMHDAMEQQEISVAKVGINATLRSRCSVLACANPKEGRWNDMVPIAQQVNLPPPLISRFDLIFIVKDQPHKENDLDISEHILKTHQNPNGEHITPVFTPEFIRKYVAYAKKTVKPVLSNEAFNSLQTFYVNLRTSNSDERVTCTPRQLEALVRLSEASAKARLSSEITSVDAERAISVFSDYLRQVGVDDLGNFDIDVIETGTSRSQLDAMRLLKNIIYDLELDNADDEGNPSSEIALKHQIIMEAEAQGIDADRTERYLKEMIDERTIYEVPGKKDCFKLN